MRAEYDAEKDTLYLELAQKNSFEIYPFETGDVTAHIDLNDDDLDDEDDLAAITIRNARRVMAVLVESGVPIEGVEVAATGSVVPSPKQGMVWYDAQANQMNAFGYDERSQTLDIVFKDSGARSYFEVPKHIFDGLRDASSQDAYWRDVIESSYFSEEK